MGAEMTAGHTRRVDLPAPRHARSDLARHAQTFLNLFIFRTIAAAFESYPELDVDEVLELCRPALLSALCEFRAGGPSGNQKEQSNEQDGDDPPRWL